MCTLIILKIKIKFIGFFHGKVFTNLNTNISVTKSKQLQDFSHLDVTSVFFFFFFFFVKFESDTANDQTHGNMKVSSNMISLVQKDVEPNFLPLTIKT